MHVPDNVMMHVCMVGIFSKRGELLSNDKQMVVYIHTYLPPFFFSMMFSWENAKAAHKLVL